MKLALSLLGLLAFAGCNAHDVSVSAWTDGRDISNKAYCFVSGAGNTTPDDLEFREFSEYARRGLAAQGYTEVAMDKADLLVSMAYGMNGPYAAPYAYMVDLSAPKATFAAVPAVQDDPPASGARMGRAEFVRHQPVFVGGYYYGSYYNGYTSTQYVRFLHLAAYDNAAGRRGDQRWRVDVISSGTENDLRRLMPFLVAAAYGYIGQDTGTQIDMTITAKDPRYKLVIGAQ